MFGRKKKIQTLEEKLKGAIDHLKADADGLLVEADDALASFKVASTRLGNIMTRYQGKIDMIEEKEKELAELKVDFAAEKEKAAKIKTKIDDIFS